MQGFLSFSSRKKRENGKFPGCSLRVSDTHKDWQLITCSFSAIYRANGNLFFLVIVFASMIKDSASFRLWFYWSFLPEEKKTFSRSFPRLQTTQAVFQIRDWWVIFCFIHFVMCFVSLLSYSVARSISSFCYFGLIRLLYFDSTRLLHLSKHGRAVFFDWCNLLRLWSLRKKLAR